MTGHESYRRGNVQVESPAWAMDKKYREAMRGLRRVTAENPSPCQIAPNMWDGYRPELETPGQAIQRMDRAAAECWDCPALKWCEEVRQSGTRVSGVLAGHKHDTNLPGRPRGVPQ